MPDLQLALLGVLRCLSCQIGRGGGGDGRRGVGRWHRAGGPGGHDGLSGFGRGGGGNSFGYGEIVVWVDWSVKAFVKLCRAWVCVPRGEGTVGLRWGRGGHGLGHCLRGARVGHGRWARRGFLDVCWCVFLCFSVCVCACVCLYSLGGL